ncbi:MAG: barstar family protein [Lachnospiraceae bacterium]|nr:barstar family protein [Lachnospiraceae bacterium]
MAVRKVLDFKGIRDRKELHKYLKDVLELPDYYGNNLDALHDCMEEKKETFWIIIYHFEELKKELGEYAEILIQVFTDMGVRIELM